MAAFVPEVDLTAPAATLWRLAVPWGTAAFIGVILVLALLYILYLIVKPCIKLWAK